MNIKQKLFKGSSAMMIFSGLVVAGMVSAALLTVYVSMTGATKVKQSVVFGNDETTKTYKISGTDESIAGNTYIANYNLKNRSETTAPIQITSNSPEGITTTYWSTVDLKQKNSIDWTINDNGTNAKLTYQLNSSMFNYELDAVGLATDTQYSLIYYADKQDRMNDWGGDNPGAEIVSFTSDENGNGNVLGSVELGMNLPASDDWNGTNEANYCASDNYLLCRGAKVWLVPTSDYDSTTKKLIAWNPDSYLFETGLITYDDTDISGGLNLGTGTLSFFVKHELDIALEEGDYTIETSVKPVQ
jgi:hypothetical protein